MKRFAGVLIVILTAFFEVWPQNVADLQRKILELANSRDYQAAITALQDLQKNDPKLFAANDYEYLLARMAESDGQLALAMASYQSVVDRDSVLRPYALVHMAGIARTTGNLMLERLLLREILLVSPDSLPARSVNYRIARNAFESGNYAETIRTLGSGSSQHTEAVSSKAAGMGYLREDQALLADAYFQAGQKDQARAVYASLIDKQPSPAQPDDAALAAARGLDLMDVGADNVGKNAPDVSEAEHQRRANIYQFNRDFANAKLHYEALIGSSTNVTNKADASFQIGRGYAQQGNYVEALAWYERVQEQYPDTVSAKDALLQAAAAYARVGKHRESIKRYQRFIEKYGSDEKLDRAYLNIVDVMRDQGDDQDALKWCARTEEVFRGKTTEAVAIFAEARIYAARDDWPNALERLEKLHGFADLGGTATPGGTSTAEVTFLKGFALEQIKRYAEAIDIYLSIHDGRNEYYGWRATGRLHEIGRDPAGASFISQKTGILAAGMKAKEADGRRQNAEALLRLTDAPDLAEKALSTLKAAIRMLPAYSAPNLKPTEKTKKDEGSTVADRLMFLGLMDEAMPETAANGKASDDTAFTVATNYLQADRGDRAIAFIEPLWKKVPADYPIELIPRGQMELLYPAVYRNSLLNFAPGRRVDPRMMLAIMRQESRFQPDARSNAAARGLMQFIATTSFQVSRELGRDSFDQDELYYPPTSVLFGAQYLADLFKVFPEQPDAVAASYNGGDDNMKRWLARSRSNLPERYVPEIMFAQSKDYVYKVMANYRMYQTMYDENLRPR